MVQVNKKKDIVITISANGCPFENIGVIQSQLAITLGHLNPETAANELDCTRQILLQLLDAFSFDGDQLAAIGKAIYDNDKTELTETMLIGDNG